MLYICFFCCNYFYCLAKAPKEINYMFLGYSFSENDEEEQLFIYNFLILLLIN